MDQLSEKKVIFVLFASPHQSGNTSKLLNYYLRNFTTYEVVIFDVYKNEVRPCIGCDYCKENNGCIYNDFAEIDRYLNIADILVIATPSYNLSFPAPLKAVFDRMQIYFSKRFFKNIVPPIEKKKEAVLLLTTGRDSEISRKIMTCQLNMIFSIINAKLAKTIVLDYTDNIEDVSLEYIEKNLKIYWFLICLINYGRIIITKL